MYLQKAYYDLDRDRCLYILEGCGVGPRACRILRIYWYRMIMVYCAEGYYREVVKVFRGVTQGEPLSPKIFNVVVDAVVHHWVSLVDGGV